MIKPGKIKYPYEDRSLDNRKGEKWKDIPGLEGFFMISNYGRIKRLQYELQDNIGRIYQKPSMICKPTLATAPNHYMGDHTFLLRAALTLDHRVHQFSIPRMVYFCFKERFAWENSGLLVICMDGNAKNIHPDNLQLVSMSERTLLIIKRQRHENILLRPKIRQIATDAMRKKVGRQISCYDLKGNKIKTYPSVPVAAKDVNKTAGTIFGAVSGRKVSCAGMLWQYGNKQKIDAQLICAGRRMKKL